MKKIFLIGGLFITASFGFGEVHNLSEKGLQLYKQGQFKKALVIFKQLQSSNTTYDANIRYNTANCFYRLGKIDKAIETYKETIRNIDRLKKPALLSKVYFNLGNAYALKADKYENESNIKQQVEYLFLSKDAFSEASFLNKKDEDIKINLKIITDKLVLKDIK